MSESIKTVGIAMPIFNESDGISSTLRTLDQVLSAEGFSVELFIQGHRSAVKNDGLSPEKRVK
jgi:hypothetical protein